MITVMLCWLIAGFFLYGYFYLTECYNDVTLFELVYYAKMPLKGGNKGPFLRELPRTISVIVSSLLLSVGFYLLMSRMNLSRGRLMLITLAPAAVMFLTAVSLLAHHLHVYTFLRLHSRYSTLYEENYVSPDEAGLTFPGKKRNLIYICLESMETCYSSASGSEADYIPELTYLAREGEDFSGDDTHINGAYAVPGATFTTGAMVAHMAGISIDLAIKEEESFIPGMRTIGDILHKEGYNQEFILGSDVVFGAREPLMRQHGGYKIFDYKSAKRDGHIPEDYYIWWGFEDEKLFDFAKKELTALSKEDKPFNFTMLTVDTHFLNGCPCRLCRNEFREQYGNVLACSSRQVDAFIKWIKQQDFYEDTAIVLAGDHPTMDSGFIKRAGLRGSERRAYVSFLNAKPALRGKKRTRRYTTLDLFPTTLSAMGVKIDGDRLGLGSDLFSDRETLLEKYGEKSLSEEFTKRSEFYRLRLLESRSRRKS